MTNTKSPVYFAPAAATLDPLAYPLPLRTLREPLLINEQRVRDQRN
ncbi:MAG: hypothetical protein ACSLFM_05420 [Tepidiformaceae bacterium]